MSVADFFWVHPAFEAMQFKKEKTAEQIVYLPVSDLSIVTHKSNKEADRTNSRYKTTYKCFNLEQRGAWTFSTLPLEDMQGVLEIPDIQFISRHIEGLRSYEMIPRCKVFLFANDFTLPNKFASFQIKDTDSAESAVLPFFLA